ncbi:MAG: hypothetical protein IT555_06160 [Acetobacteraceae bacterium]|nr:hypothetical protein [Acetobacteraceae bacterium]
MFGWTRRVTEQSGQGGGGEAAAPATLVHDIVHVQVLGLLVTDTFRWKRDWATWRIRFAYSNENAGQSARDVAFFVREAAAQLCQHRCDCADNVLYLSHMDDVRAVFAAYGMVPHGPGQISAIQSRDTYRQAATLAAELAALARVPDRAVEDEATALPDLTWSVEGHGMGRVASTELRGRRVVVRLGVVSGQEMWLVDVNDRPGCARFRSRVDAMSKMGVAAAIKGYESRHR